MKRKNSFLIFLLSWALWGLLISACSDKNEPFKVSTHPDGWEDENSANFHGKLVLESTFKNQNCATCHGADLKGGTSGVSCQTSGCHTIYPHSEAWVDSSSTEFHGLFLKASGYALDACQECHGNDFKGAGFEEKSCYRCHNVYPHGENFADEDNPQYHGNVAAQLDYNLETCQECHGEDFKGNGVEEKNCYQCHSEFPHPQGFAEEGSDNFHARLMATQFAWNLKACQECHGTDYQGKGNEEKNCTRCHTSAQGPEACNTCHGSAANPAPPEDLEGHSETSFEGVGAHQVHLTDSTFTTNLVGKCEACHHVPTSFDDPMHIDADGLPVEITFDPLASDSGQTIPQWNESTLSCENVYCHGGFTLSKNKSAYSWIYTDSVITGNNPTLKWTEDEVQCGVCHDLPPKGHLTQTTCNGCHGRVVDAENNIIDRHLHINGKADVF